jgi:hypothetical protein
MKKLLLLLVVFIIGAAGAFAFDPLSYPPSVSGGNILVDVGIGFTGAEYGKISIPPLRVSAEYALPVEVPISVGGLFAFHSTKYTWGGDDLAWTFFTFGARANWHWNINVPWLDLYSGLILGYQVSSLDYDGPNASFYENYFELGGFMLGGQVGAHLYFTEMLGAFVEFGYPYWASAGLALKF